MDLIEILLIEDNLADLFLIESNIKAGKITNKVNIVKNTYEALQFLNKEGRFSQRTCPDIILINITLLPENDTPLLEKLKNHDVCRDLEIIVLTNNEVEEEILKNNGIDYPFLRRPFEIGNLIKLLVLRGKFRLVIVRIEQ